jgi:undecaprenyl-phosphate 4-deoxy-4-formamido-L-arabinose transferase
MTAFSVKPLRIASLLGMLFAIIGFIWTIVVVIKKILMPEIIMGYSSMMAVILFSNGLMMLMMGLLGEYLGRTYISINDYPQYVVKETVNIGERTHDTV